MPDLPVMMVTAYGDDERRRRAGEYGAAEFVTKPVDFDLLKQQLQQLPSQRIGQTVSEPAKILAVDDEPDFELLIRQRFRRQIREGEFTFRFAHHGEEALAVLAAEPDIDLLLLDINMPVMDGLTLLTELRERQSPVRAIIVSAYGDMTNIAHRDEPRRLRFRHQAGRSRRSRDHHPQDARRHRQAARASTSSAPRPSGRAPICRRYFSPNIVEMLAEQRRAARARCGGRPSRVLFVDIVGFTRMAEAMAPEAVVTMLREFHERMTAQIFACGGTVEKYIGDEIFAVFGVPDAEPDDAANALRCADMMLAALDALERRARARTGEPPLAIGIGLNYGPAVLGDVGSEHSLSFTVIGDTVNTASRLQGLTRELKTPLGRGGRHP